MCSTVSNIFQFVNVISKEINGQNLLVCGDTTLFLWNQCQHFLNI